MFMKYRITALLAASTLLLSGCTVSVTMDTHKDTPEPEDAKTAEIGTSDEASAAGALRDAVASESGLGDDAIIGACLGTQSIGDERLFEIAMTQFNAITLENELKPDAMFGYNNSAPFPGSIHEEEVDGKMIEVPTLDHSRADAMLDKLLAWNESHPDRAVKVRGHVLVWHSQTPEWFFHEGYDAGKDYVSSDVMDKRMQWYISSVLGYYTGDDSRYKDMFYGWDVVNEAISDRTGSYRTENETPWWKVYGSNEYIISAFRYANRYASPDVDLYYNDYNECDKLKMKGILTLISDVKAAEGTRIDGFGMQGHYSAFSPNEIMIEDAARAYAEVVDKIMITELDVKASMFYNGSAEGLPEEYERQAEYIGNIYELFKKLHREGINVAGITFWGVSDRYSWLRDKGEHPLLFDEDYEPKSAYFRFLKNE